MFFSIPNVTSIVVTPINKPWEYDQTTIPDSLYKSQDKLLYRQWSENPATTHAFISGNEGLDAGRRISYDKEDTNPALKCHAIIVDYDATNLLTPQLLEDIKSGKEKWPSDYAPSYIADSFTRGRLRAIWNFEAPVLIASQKHYKKFIQILDKKIKFNKWFSGFEADSLGNPAHYYMIGSNYRECRPDKYLRKSHLDLWSFEAANQVMDSMIEQKFQIPMEEIALEVERQFPGRWHGPFEVGARGVRFWDHDAKDQNGCQVTEHGMMAYSGEQAFLPWNKILGSKFVEKFEADKISGIIDNVVLEYKKGSTSSTYWVRLQKNEEGLPERWVCMNQTQITTFLKCAGFSSTIVRGHTASEVDKILNQVNMTNSVTGAFPYIHYPHGKIKIDGEWKLNTSTVKVWPPAPEGMCMTLEEGRSYFPTIWGFLSNFFEPTPRDSRSSSIQLEFFLSWLQHAYQLYYRQEPQSGLILILCGPQSAGKTFLLQRIISPLLGGSHDIKDVLTGKYTDLLTQSPVAYVDDMSHVTNAEEHRKYSEQMKALVSNNKITFDGKWKATGETWWMGRVVVCMNDDASSLRMLPDLSLSMAGKVGMLMINRNRDDGFRFSSDWAKTKNQIDKELSFFARYLLSGWKTPEYLENHSNPRYYVVPYKHPELYHEAQERGIKHELFELLQEFMEDNALANKNKDYQGWTGTTTALLGSLSSGKYDIVMRKWNQSRLGTALGMLASTTNIRRVKGANNVSVWHIPPDFGYLKQEEFGEKIHTKADESKRILKMKKVQELQDAGQIVPEDLLEDAKPYHNKKERPIVPGVPSNTELQSLAAALRDGKDTQENKDANSGENSGGSSAPTTQKE